MYDPYSPFETRLPPYGQQVAPHAGALNGLAAMPQTGPVPGNDPFSLSGGLTGAMGGASLSKLLGMGSFMVPGTGMAPAAALAAGGGPTPAAAALLGTSVPWAAPLALGGALAMGSGK